MGGMAILPQSFFAGDTVETAPGAGGQVSGAAVRRAHAVRPAHRDGGLRGPGGQGLPRLQLSEDRPDADTVCPPGTAYVYLIYGLHCCLNFVTEPEGEPAAILIRGGEARGNLDSLTENRFHCKASELTAYQKKNLLNGPGKLCAALNIDRGLNGLPWGSPELFLCDSLSDAGLPPCPGDERPPDVKCGKRVGIDYAGEAVDFPWRFYV